MMSWLCLYYDAKYGVLDRYEVDSHEVHSYEVHSCEVLDSYDG